MRNQSFRESISLVQLFGATSNTRLTETH